MTSLAEDNFLSFSKLPKAMVMWKFVMMCVIFEHESVAIVDSRDALAPLNLISALLKINS